MHPLCRRWTGLVVGTSRKQSHVSLNVWFWAAYLIFFRLPIDMSAILLPCQPGLNWYKTVFCLPHEMRTAMIRPDLGGAGGLTNQHVEVYEARIGGRVRDKGRGVHRETPVVAATDQVRRQELGTAQDRRRQISSNLSDFIYRFNRRFCPFSVFRSLLNIDNDIDGLPVGRRYSGQSRSHTISIRCMP